MVVTVTPLKLQVGSPAKETKGDASTKEGKVNDLKSSHPPSLPDADNKDSEEEWKCQ